MSNNKITVGVSKSAPELKNRAISLIVALSGEDPMVLAHKTEDELLQYLSYLLKMEKQKLEDLLVEHDQAKEEDLVNLMKHWKTIAKGKMNVAKRISSGKEGKDQGVKMVKTVIEKSQIMKKK
jgi:hypothetical protein